MKLSISMKDDLVKRARSFAQKNGQSLSGLLRVSLEGYLRYYVYKSKNERGDTP